MSDKSDRNGLIYEIKILGVLDEKWSQWFAGLQITSEKHDDHNSITNLVGVVPDQANLRGILNKIWDLNLTIISVNPVRDDDIPASDLQNLGIDQCSNTSINERSLS